MTPRSLTQDELTTTKRSYEDQLSMMSDHLCSMNETLTKQREEIDTLKLGSKVVKYRVFKIQWKIVHCFVLGLLGLREKDHPDIKSLPVLR